MDNWKPQLYSDKHAFVYQYGEVLTELLKPGADEEILDLGCGSGELTAKIAQSAGRVIGMDFSANMIARARRNYPHLEFRQADASNFEFQERFDAIFSNAALHWVKDYAGAIACMHKHLKPGGRLILEFGGKGNVQSIIAQLRRSLEKRGHIERAQKHLWFFPSIGEYSSALEKAGFSVNEALLYDRPTELADEAAGIKDWLSMFANAFFEGLAQDEVEGIKDEIQEALKDSCLLDGKWMADYKRLRIIAEKS